MCRKHDQIAFISRTPGHPSSSVISVNSNRPPKWVELINLSHLRRLFCAADVSTIAAMMSVGSCHDEGGRQGGLVP